MKKSSSLWIILLLVAIAFLYFPTYSKYLKLKRQEDRLAQDIAELQAKVDELKKEEYLIKNDPAHLEQVVRKELGLVKPGEIVYKVVPFEAKPAQAQTKQEVKPQAPTAPKI